MPSVLIVDDEPNIRRMVGALLDAPRATRCATRPTARTGSRARAESEPDVVLLDLMMPGELDGLATLARLRESLPDVPVVMMSGTAGLSDAVKATKLGAFNFLEKPLTPGGRAARAGVGARAAAGAPRSARAARGPRTRAAR